MMMVANEELKELQNELEKLEKELNGWKYLWKIKN
jgi:hypothetical protein